MKQGVDLKKIKSEILVTLLGMYKGAGAGHIGSSLSCLDILVVLYFFQMRQDDKFILSKGHAAAVLYAVLNKKGNISDEQLATYYKDGTYLPAHPPCGNNKIDGVDFGTGSLGHGLSLATGLAFSAKLQKKDAKIYCVVSDGDCNEGSTWEAAMFAAQHKLDNLVVIFDNNKLQGFGRSEDVINLEPVMDKWKAFNFEVFEAKNGNDLDDLQKQFDSINKSQSDKPKCIVARTLKGSGVSFMTDKLEWHYLPMNDDQFTQAISEVRGLDA
jgi:transketolase